MSCCAVILLDTLVENGADFLIFCSAFIRGSVALDGCSQVCENKGMFSAFQVLCWIRMDRDTCKTTGEKYSNVTI